MKPREWLIVAVIAVTASLVGGGLLGAIILLVRDWYNGRSPLW